MIKAEYVSHMGDDLMVVNAARVSFAKQSEWEKVDEGLSCDDADQAFALYSERLSDRDAKLIRYLAGHNHWTPFAHPQVSLRMSAPIFVARQAFKHKVGFVENEISRRYVDDEPEFYLPDAWRARPDDNKKQGSDPRRTVSGVIFRDRNSGDRWSSDPGAAVSAFYSSVLALYEDLIDGGVAPEQARMVLPQAMMTEWYWTGSLASWARFCRLRLAADAQAEISDLAACAEGHIAPLFPVSWAALAGAEA